MKLKEKTTYRADRAESVRQQGLMNILLVDDSAFFLKAAMRFLSELGAVTSLATAHSGADAVQAVLRNRPDLVLMDISMPGMSGLAAVRRIKAVAPEVRIVVVSLNESSDFRAAAEAAGADGYIAKRDFATGVVALFAAQPDPQG